jgi:dipeptidyl-peptidase-3
MLSVPPYGLGFPSETAQSAYYMADTAITRDDIATISRVLEEHSIFPEDTRIRKVTTLDTVIYEVPQASIEEENESTVSEVPTLTLS